MATYRILYQVETTDADGTVRMTSFASEAEADAWIAEQQRMARAADRWERQSPGYAVRD
jgi:hypothetical protein